VCGSDLWDYRGINPVDQPTPIGHEYVGVVEQVGDDVKNITVGDSVVDEPGAESQLRDLDAVGQGVGLVQNAHVLSRLFGSRRGVVGDRSTTQIAECRS
jgi:NADPH:quinone reductase-like Zn-dependent oxidoreductase